MATEPSKPTLNEQDLRDLGFGAVVSRESQQRLLNRDGSFNVERTGLRFWSSFSAYHAMLTMPWWQFFLATAVLYLIVNAAFAAAYLACGPGALGSETAGMENHTYLRAFFFSVQTLSTIGYGQVVPIGTAANTLVTLEVAGWAAGFRHRDRTAVCPVFATNRQDAVQPSRVDRALSEHHGGGVPCCQRPLQRTDRSFGEGAAQPV